MKTKNLILTLLVLFLFSCSQENELLNVSNQSGNSIVNLPTPLSVERDIIIAEYSNVFSNTLIFDSWSEADSTSSSLVNMNVDELFDFQQQHNFSGQSFNSFLYLVNTNLNLNPAII